jgi:hypothetical protein
MIASLILASTLVLCVGLGYVLGLLIGLGVSSDWRDRKRAEEKSIILLRSWLTEERASQWDLYKGFDVIGVDTGRRYRITRGTSMNIHELDFAGKIVAHWCFAPQGNLAVGDVLLAQKIALETMEGRALTRANRQAR